MATVSGAVVLDTAKLWQECQFWAEFELYKTEAYNFINTKLKPIIDKENVKLSLTDYVPTTISGSDIDLLYDMMEAYRKGFNIHDSYEIAAGIKTDVELI